MGLHRFKEGRAAALLAYRRKVSQKGLTNVRTRRRHNAISKLLKSSLGEPFAGSKTPTPNQEGLEGEDPEHHRRKNNRRRRR